MEGAEDVGHGFSGGEGFFADALEIEVDLGVGVVGGEVFGQFQGEGGLADSALALESGDVDAAFFDGGAQFAEFGGASGEVGGRGRELEERCEGWGWGFMYMQVPAHDVAFDSCLSAADADSDML